MKHLVGFSGGIDSQACADWVLEREDPDDVILMNSDAGGNEHPLTTEHVRWYSEHVHPVVMVSATVADMGNKARAKRLEMGLADAEPLTFDLLAKLKGRFPSRKAQFCTEHLKLAPQRRWIAEQEGDLLREGYCRYSGVRADESTLRSKAAAQEWDDYFDCDLFRPLLKWTKAECFGLVQKRGERINPLYTMGFERVGCAPCINAKKEDVLRWASYAPEMIEKVRQWEQQNGRTFFPPCVPGLTINWIDEVVAWSKTAWGARQLALPYVEAEAASGGCSSKYGLCE